MKRLTESAYGQMRTPPPSRNKSKNPSHESLYKRLAAIEDILGDEYDLDRLTPCTFCQFNPPSSSDGKPCCMCPAEAALRREQDEQ